MVHRFGQNLNETHPTWAHGVQADEIRARGLQADESSADDSRGR